MYLADSICIVRVRRPQVLSFNIQNLPMWHKIAYLRKARTLSRTTLGGSLQLSLADYYIEGTHVGQYFVLMNSIIPHLQCKYEVHILFSHFLLFLYFCYEFMVLREAPFITITKFINVTCTSTWAFSLQYLASQSHPMYPQNYPRLLYKPSLQ